MINLDKKIKVIDLERNYILYDLSFKGYLEKFTNDFIDNIETLYSNPNVEFYEMISYIENNLNIQLNELHDIIQVEDFYVLGFEENGIFIKKIKDLWIGEHGVYKNHQLVLIDE